MRYQTSSKTPLLFYNTLKPTKTVDTDTNGILLVTMDLYSLYTNIPHTEAVSLIVEHYQETLVYWHKYNNNLKPVDTNHLKFFWNICYIIVISVLTIQYLNSIMEHLWVQNASVRIANIFMHKLL